MMILVSCISDVPISVFSNSSIINSIFLGPEEFLNQNLGEKSFKEAAILLKQQWFSEVIVDWKKFKIHYVKSSILFALR